MDSLSNVAQKCQDTSHMVLSVRLVEFESIRGFEVHRGLLDQEDAIAMMSSFIGHLHPGGSPL